MMRQHRRTRSARVPHRIAALALWVALGGAAGAQDSNYRLAPGDRLGLSVYGQAELSGEFVVNGNGALFLPLVGEVSVSAMTLPEAQKQIVSQLADGFLQQPVVSLRITEMRPIYLLGDVRVAGSYPFRYGASVLSGIALAGGFALPEQAQISQRTEFLSADERVRVLEATLRLLTVRRERLEAQRQDREDFTPPRGSERDEGFTRLLAEERGILKAQRSAFAQSAEMLRAQKPRIEAEIAGVEAQRKAEETQLRLIQSHLEDYEKLISNGLARRYQGIELQREEARNKGTIARLNSELARLDLAIGDLALRGQELTDTYHRRILAELQDVTTRLTEVEMQLPSAREIREARLQSGGTLGAASPGSPARKVFITRAVGERTETFEANERALLQPGDIIDVRREPPTSPIRTSLALPEPGSLPAR
ncbi:hypothetical protein MBUL_00819 [Methylobacterium bullatum]|uniref:Polysialic acid transport protein KpsD n=1 Tax=Methylobacterium bullatum TaxID=570505 RepID=A0A679J393_9HYPH|nr:hypothetical protein MBUL_00819 [Methylobacterium bullatum]